MSSQYLHYMYIISLCVPFLFENSGEETTPIASTQIRDNSTLNLWLLKIQKKYLLVYVLLFFFYV